MRVRLYNDRELYPKRGLGIWFRCGNLGSEYGDSRDKLFLDFVVLFFVWKWVLSLLWRR